MSVDREIYHRELLRYHELLANQLEQLRVSMSRLSDCNADLPSAVSQVESIFNQSHGNSLLIQSLSSGQDGVSRDYDHTLWLLNRGCGELANALQKLSASRSNIHEAGRFMRNADLYFRPLIRFAQTGEWPQGTVFRSVPVPNPSSASAELGLTSSTIVHPGSTPPPQSARIIPPPVPPPPSLEAVPLPVAAGLDLGKKVEIILSQLALLQEAVAKQGGTRTMGLPEVLDQIEAAINIDPQDGTGKLIPSLSPHLHATGPDYDYVVRSLATIGNSLNQALEQFSHRRVVLEQVRRHLRFALVCLRALREFAQTSKWPRRSVFKLPWARNPKQPGIPQEGRKKRATPTRYTRSPDTVPQYDPTRTQFCELQMKSAEYLRKIKHRISIDYPLGNVEILEALGLLIEPPTLTGLEGQAPGAGISLRLPGLIESSLIRLRTSACTQAQTRLVLDNVNQGITCLNTAWEVLSRIPPPDLTEVESELALAHAAFLAVLDIVIPPWKA